MSDTGRSAGAGVGTDDVDTSGVFVVIAAYQESAKIGEVVREVARGYPNVIVVDDGSADGTARAARDAGATVLVHVINRGQGAALQTGIDAAVERSAACIVTFDADGQHDAADIRAMVSPILRGECAVTLGSRFLGEAVNMPMGRKLILRAAVVFGAMTSGVRLTDAHNGFRAFSTEAVSKIEIMLDRMAHASEIIDQIRRHRLSYKEVPVKVRYTEYSISKGQSSRRAVRIVFDYMIGKVLR